MLLPILRHNNFTLPSSTLAAIEAGSFFLDEKLDDRANFDGRSENQNMNLLIDLVRLPIRRLTNTLR